MSDGRQMQSEARWRWYEAQGGPEGSAMSWSRDQPQEPRVGECWLDPRCGIPHVWDGNAWVAVAAD